jgi:hypothetical protein
VQGNEAKEETTSWLVLDAMKAMKTLLPNGWEVTHSFVPPEETLGSDPGYDATILIRAPDNQVATFLTEVRPGRLAGANHVLEKLRRVGVAAGREVLLVAPYLGPALREQCERQRVNYLDLTGWCWLQASAPAMAIRAIGAAKDPRPPRNSVITRLNGASAGRIIRSLLTIELPLGVRALAERAAVSAGTVSKVLKELDSEAIVARDGSGQVAGVDKRLLVTRWTRDYSFLKTNNVGWYLAPRGIDQLVKRALKSKARLVETGSSAARRHLPRGVLPITGTSQIALYVPRAAEAAEILGVVPSDRAAANVLLAEPYDVELLRQLDGPAGHLPAVDLGQVIADLMTMPGRAAQEADQLMDVLATADEGWKRS